jgi:hypothetical protein
VKVRKKMARVVPTQKAGKVPLAAGDHMATNGRKYEKMTVPVVT